MRNRVFIRVMVSLCFSLVAGVAFGQYPATGNKQRLGFQTTGDGLVYRGAIGDTATIDPVGIANAWMLIDTASGFVYAYRGKRWQLVTAIPYMPFDSVTFNNNEEDADSAELKYNADIGSLAYGGNDGAQIPVLPGHWYVRNDDTITLTKGTVVMATGTLGASGRILAKRMIADGSVPAMYILGIVAKDIPVGKDGYVMWQGKIRKLNTNAYAPGTVLYADWFVPGGLTDFLPAAPNLKLPIAFVVHQSSNSGVIAVRVTAGEYLRELHDVDVGGAVSGDILRYDGSTWVESKDTSIYDYDGYLSNNRNVLLSNYSITFRDSMNDVDNVQIRDTYVAVRNESDSLTQSLSKFGLFSFQNNNTLNTIIHNYNGGIRLRANTSATTVPEIDPDFRILPDGRISFRLSAGGSPDSLYAKNTNGYLTAVPNTLGEKLNIADTASMLATYVNFADTSAMLASYLKTETPQQLSAFDAATNAAALDLSTQGGSAGEALIVVDPNNATPWDGFAVVGIVLQYQSRVIFTGQGGILVSTANNQPYADTVRVAADTAAVLASKAWVQGRGYLVGGDTVSLSNRINTKLNISDTTAMLSSYLRKADTLSLSNRINTKLNISDTTAMLSTYIRNYGTQTVGGAKTFSSTVTGLRFDPTGGTAAGNGMFLPAANTLGFSTNGGQRMTISSTGNVGINNTSPVTRLNINASSGQAAWPATSGTTQSTGHLVRLGLTGNLQILDIGVANAFWIQATNSASLEVGSALALNPNRGPVLIGKGATDQSIATLNVRASKVNQSAILYLQDTLDSPVFIAENNGQVGVKTIDPTRDFHVQGEIRVTDLDAGVLPTQIVGADANGVFDALSIGVGLQINNGSLQTNEAGATWTQQSAAGNNDFWWGITYANNQFVAVGGGDATDRVMTSPDGVNWTARSAAGNDDTWRSVVYGNGLYVAVGDAGGDRVMTSPDGITWTARSAAGNNDKWNSVAFGDNRFVAVSYEGDRVMTSPDGITWTVQSAAGNNDTWYSVTYGNNQFVAVGGGTDRVMTSPDGITWTVQTAAQNNSWYGVTYGNGLYVAVSEDGTDRVMTSSNGSTWTARSTPGDSRSWNAVSYGEGKYIAVATNSDSVMVSENGTSWNYVPSISGHTSNYGIAYGNGIFAAVGTASNRVMTSGKTTSTVLPERRTLVAQDSLDFSSISAGASQTLTITVNGAELSDPVSIGIPNNATTNTTLIFSAFVSASNTVSVRCYNSATSGSADADKGLFKVIVHKY